MPATDNKLSDAQLAEIKERNRCDDVARQWVRLHKVGGKLAGPCPICSADRDSKGAARFEVTADSWVCAVCHDGGDVIRLVQKVEGKTFLDAVAWLGGARQIDPAAAKRLEEERAAKRAKSEAGAKEFRERERGKTFDIWNHGVPADDPVSPIGAYFKARGLTLPIGARLRAIGGMPYYETGKKDADPIGRFDAMLAPIVGRDGKFSGIHVTYIDPAAPKAKARPMSPETGEILPAKKVRGSKTGGRIEIVGPRAPETLIEGEGIETAVAVQNAMEASGANLSSTAFWSAVDLGNLGGRAADSVAHPTAMTPAGRPQRVPGPVPDFDAPGIPIPPSVTRLIFLRDGDSDPFLTDCAIMRAIARAEAAALADKRALDIRVASPPAGLDFDDLKRELGDAGVMAAIDGALSAAEFVRKFQQTAQTEDTSARPQAAHHHNDSAGRGAAGSDRSSPDADQSDLPPAPPDPPAPPPDAPPGAPVGAFSASTLPDAKPSQTGSRRKKPAEGGGRGRDRGNDNFAEGAEGLNKELAYFPQTDLGNAERFKARFRDRLRFCPALGWLWWDGRRWNRDGADSRVKLAEHRTARAIQEEADAISGIVEEMTEELQDAIAESERLEAEAKAARKAGGKSRAKPKRKRKKKDDSDDKEIITPEIAEAMRYRLGLIGLAKTLRNHGRATEAANRLGAISKRAEPMFYVAPDALDADPFKINFLNGTLTIDRHKRGAAIVAFADHNPDDLITKLAGVDYDPEATAPIYDRFLAGVQPEAANRRFLHQWGGLSLTGDISDQKLVFFHGKGRNGKSTLLEAWAQIAGDYGKAIPVETFINEGRARASGQATPDLAMLKGVRFAHTNEPEKGQKLSEGLVKLVTGGDEVQVRELHRGYFSLKPLFKLTMSGNYKPSIPGGDASHGIWRRMVLISWGVTIAEKDVDRALPAKLRAEASGILNRLLEGLRDWCEDGLRISADIKASTEEYRSDSDPLGRFMAACTEPLDGGRVQSSQLYGLFVAWAKANGEREWSSTGFGRAMKERGYHSHKSDVSWWLDIKTTKAPADFIDAHGQPLGADAADDQRERLHDDEVPF